jgi:hypothetical protein
MAMLCLPDEIITEILLKVLNPIDLYHFRVSSGKIFRCVEDGHFRKPYTRFFFHIYNENDIPQFWTEDFKWLAATLAMIKMRVNTDDGIEKVIKENPDFSYLWATKNEDIVSQNLIGYSELFKYAFIYFPGKPDSDYQSDPLIEKEKFMYNFFRIYRLGSGDEFWLGVREFELLAKYAQLKRGKNEQNLVRLTQTYCLERLNPQYVETVFIPESKNGSGFSPAAEMLEIAKYYLGRQKWPEVKDWLSKLMGLVSGSTDRPFLFEKSCYYALQYSILDQYQIKLFDEIAEVKDVEEKNNLLSLWAHKIDENVRKLIEGKEGTTERTTIFDLSFFPPLFMNTDWFAKFRDIYIFVPKRSK